MLSYRTILEPASAEYVDRRSRFLATVLPVADEAAAQAYLAGRREQYWDAKHHVYAFRLLENRLERYSDDAEPHGTAGRPALGILAGRDLWNVMVVVTRYFGGTLLGTGGLVQAYAGSTRLALDAAQLVEMRPGISFFVDCDYSQYELLRRIVAQCGGTQCEADFTDRVRLRATIENNRFQTLQETLREQLSGTLTLQKTGEILTPFQINS